MSEIPVRPTVYSTPPTTPEQQAAHDRARGFALGALLAYIGNNQTLALRLLEQGAAELRQPK